jgi:hypothetical protein
MKMQFANTTQRANAPFLVRAVVLIWEHMALLIFADLLLYLAVLPVIVAWLIGFQLLAPWVAVLTLGPTWIGVSASAQRLVAGEEVSWRALLMAIRQHWSLGIRISAVPALMASVFMGTFAILAVYSHASWLYLPLFIDGCITTLGVLVSLTAFSLALSHRLRGWTLWKVSLAVTRLQLGKLLGMLILFGVLGALVVMLNFGLLPFLCAPLAICLAVLTQQTCESLPDSKESV